MVSRLKKRMIGMISTNASAAQSDILRRLVNRESQIGSEILGYPAHGGRREFFMSPTHSNEWLWHEETPDGNKVQTVRYIISEDEGIFKSINGATYEVVKGKEFENLMSAIKTYYKRVMHELYPTHIRRTA